ncbi:uncharacterized protein CTRU02_202451 [Colletotrichum truncatum]|uniref:Uncharacterized protein n=1 Tax=Colletotrichum truncatum TaxID=5467 RepID=A0ACC3ZKA0_COLTU|nr:uncharacterized protein CTRU02_01618 [Colletotrichum truncatum]KAF6799939.1 hypothetical protein CTRU02_01618 [Colletotrichum truncatum]
MQFSQSSLLQSLIGVAYATKSGESEIAPVEAWIYSVEALDKQAFDSWWFALEKSLNKHLTSAKQVQIASLAVLVSFLRESSRNNLNISYQDLKQCWDIIRKVSAVSSISPSEGLLTAYRSSQGFLVIPLCSLVKEGDNEELIRLHVWLPDDERGNPDYSVRSNQSLVQSWVLAGESRSYHYKVEPVVGIKEATHAKFSLASSGNSTSEHNAADRAHPTHSIIANTGELVIITEKASYLHERNTSYSIPAATFYSSYVRPDSLHAAFCFFDANQSSVEETSVLGPPDEDSYKDSPEPSNITPTQLIEHVDAVRAWELLIEESRRHAQKAEWEDALRVLNSALSLSITNKSLPNAKLYEHLVLGELGSINRRFGRYAAAKHYLEKGIDGLKPCIQRVEFSGELGVTYRQMGFLKDAINAFTQQYNIAKELGSDREICRAIGNMGMVNYQLSQRKKDKELLDLAMRQLQERVDRSERLLKTTSREADSPSTRHWLKVANTWKTIGLCRLSICHCALGNIQEALQNSEKALWMTINSDDATVKAMTRFFHGKALLMAGRKKEALNLFNIQGTCSPAIAFAKEPSEEHREYLQELVDNGADLCIVDEQGYTAIDHAVFNGDTMAENIILNGLRKSAEENINQIQAEARLRKGYRELFQERLRPVLLSGGQDVLSNLRKAYADALKADETMKAMFDGLKFMWYSQFRDFNRLPRSNDGLAREFNSSFNENAESPAEKVVFISYRWINREPGAKTPDDAKHTQYRRMINAIEEYLKINPSVDRERLGIWMDHACVDQDDPNAGVAALPMFLAQCDAMISLYDDQYYDRAWCAVEVIMIETLRSSYGIHQWYEHIEERAGDDCRLREAEDRQLSMENKILTFETDRPKVLFLERQSRLLR